MYSTHIHFFAQITTVSHQKDQKQAVSSTTVSELLECVERIRAVAEHYFLAKCVRTGLTSYSTSRCLSPLLLLASGSGSVDLKNRCQTLGQPCGQGNRSCCIPLWGVLSFPPPAPGSVRHEDGKIKTPII